jgi:hypothetical protein
VKPGGLASFFKGILGKIKEGFKSFKSLLLRETENTSKPSRSPAGGQGSSTSASSSTEDARPDPVVKEPNTGSTNEQNVGNPPTQIASEQIAMKDYEKQIGDEILKSSDATHKLSANDLKKRIKQAENSISQCEKRLKYEEENNKKFKDDGDKHIEKLEKDITEASKKSESRNSRNACTAHSLEANEICREISRLKAWKDSGYKDDGTMDDKKTIMAKKMWVESYKSVLKDMGVEYSRNAENTSEPSRTPAGGQDSVRNLSVDELKKRIEEAEERILQNQECIKYEEENNEKFRYDEDECIEELEKGLAEALEKSKSPNSEDACTARSTADHIKSEISRLKGWKDSGFKFEGDGYYNDMIKKDKGSVEIYKRVLAEKES